MSKSPIYTCLFRLIFQTPAARCIYVCMMYVYLRINGLLPFIFLITLYSKSLLRKVMYKQTVMGTNYLFDQMVQSFTNTHICKLEELYK